MKKLALVLVVVLCFALVAGAREKEGPLSGKKIGLLVASEFSDFQAYYLICYLSEFGAKVENILVDWVKWKYTRPNVSSKSVTGMWDLTLDPVPTMGLGDRHTFVRFDDADVNSYDGIVILGGNSPDVMKTEQVVIDFVKAAYDNGAVIGAIERGPYVLTAAGLSHGRKVTGYKVMKHILARIGEYLDQPVVRDGRIITARDTDATAECVREFCRAFAPNFDCGKKDILKDKRTLIVAGQDFEDIELAVPAMEFMYRGAKVIFGTFPPPVVARPPMLGLDVVMGNFGMSVPFQEIRDTAYTIAPLSKIHLDDFDLIMIPGAFCPDACLADGTPVRLLREAYDAGKVVAAICHGPMVLAAADVVEGRKITGWLASKDDVEIMGGIWRDDLPAIVEGNVVSGRTPDDVPEFIDAMTEALLAQ